MKRSDTKKPDTTDAADIADITDITDITDDSAKLLIKQAQSLGIERPFKLWRTCKSAQTLIYARQDFGLVWHEQLALRSHLWVCSNCTIVQANVAVLREQLKRWFNNIDDHSIDDHSIDDNSVNKNKI